MGSAFYYLKATFPKPLKKKEKDTITTFFLEGAKAEIWWQDNRGRKDVKNFWIEFEKQFPTVCLYLKFMKLFGKDHSNGLAGKLDFGTEEDVNNNLCTEGISLRYHAEVWHFASWDGLGAFLKSHFGAIDFKYLSDEYLDPSEILEMKDTNVIVQDILRQKKILPTLIGINPVLDAMISETLTKSV